MFIAFGILAFLLVAGALGTVGFMLFSKKEDSVHDRLAALDAGAGVADEESALSRFINAQQQKILYRRFLEAGWYDMTAGKYLLKCFIFGVVGFVVSILCALAIHPSFLLQMLLVVVMTAGGFYYPGFGLTSAVEKRKVAIGRALPDFLDLISSTVEAGIALSGAITIAADGMTGPIAQELKATLQDIRLGRSRTDALMAAAQRVNDQNFTSTIMAIVQADKLGGDVANVLEQLAHDARDQRVQRAEELANALPNKLVFPMALFMLPSLFVVIFGAVAVNLMNNK